MSKTPTDPEFYVKSRGRLIPLEEAVWVKWAPCGCAYAAVSAIMPDGKTPILTEDAAFRRMQEKSSHPKDLVERYQRKGYTVSLVTDKRYQEVVTTAIFQGCLHLPKWGEK